MERVWEKGEEKSFKLVGIEIDEDLSWKHHIAKIGKKVNSAIYGLRKTYKHLGTKNKKLLYSGLIHSHLVYGLLIWGFAKAGKLQTLVVKQKKAIQKVFNLKFRDHTHNSFTKGAILKLPDLIKHTTLCYLHSGLAETSPNHVKQLWEYSMANREANYIP